MAKAKPTFNTGGYSEWTVRRTLREAENAARWSPWCAVKWMEEARNRISIYDPFFDEYDKSANRINALWRSYEKYIWYEARAFWRQGNISHPPQRIPLLADPTKDTSLDDFSHLLKSN